MSRPGYPGQAKFHRTFSNWDYPALSESMQYVERVRDCLIRALSSFFDNIQYVDVDTVDLAFDQQCGRLVGSAGWRAGRQVQ